MTFKLLCAMGLALSFGVTAHAGRPYPKELTCPVGSEIFEITSTLSCSTLGNTLSLKSITSCDFVTKIPICPKNGLPMYQEFSADELQRVEAYMDTQDYKANRDKGRYYRAYLMDKALFTSDIKKQYFLLQNGLWSDESVQNLGHADYLKAYHSAAEAYFDSVKDNKDAQADLGVYIGGQAFIYFKSGELKKAKARLSAAKAFSEGKNAFRDDYFKILDACFNSALEDVHCQMNTPIRGHKALESEAK